MGDLSHSREFRSRAVQTLILFATVVVISILISVPGQAKWVLGVEVLLIAALDGFGSYHLDRRAKQDENPLALSHLLDVVSPNALIMVLLVAAGVLLVFDLTAGLYVLVATALIAIVGGLTSAWLFLTLVNQ